MAVAGTTRWLAAFSGVLSLSFLAGALPFCAAQAVGGPQVRLEPHEGKTQFQLGDLIWVDLVFTSQQSGYGINAGTYYYLPVPDEVQVQPGEGWSRSHRSIDESLGDLPVPLGRAPVRVPVLLNREVTFTRPGRYLVTVQTDRVLVIEQYKAGPRLGTNPVAIEIGPRSEPDERALVKKLYAELVSGPREARPPHVDNPESLSPEQREKLVSDALRNADKLEEDRREAAWKLAFLPGDEAMRAKVALLGASVETGEATPIEPLLVQGLASSRDVGLQAELLDAAWRNPDHVPTGVLETALRQARELLRSPTVLDSQLSSKIFVDPAIRAEMEATSTTILEEQKDLAHELAGTLGQREPANREQTICFLKVQGVEPDGSDQPPARCE